MLQKIKTFSDQISFSVFKKLLFKELKKYTRLPVFFRFVPADAIIAGWYQYASVQLPVWLESYLKILPIKKLFNTWNICTVLINFSLLQISSLTTDKLITYRLANTILILSLLFLLLFFLFFHQLLPPAPCKKLCTLFFATAAAGEKPHLAPKHA